MLLDRAGGRDRQVARLLDLPAMSTVRSGRWDLPDLLLALARARAVAAGERRHSLTTAIDMATARLQRGSGPVTVTRAHATEGIRRIRLR